MNLFNKMMIPAFAAALTIGASVASQAQVNFIDTNIGLNLVSVASGNGGVTATTTATSATVRYPTNGATESYNLNSAGTTDAAVRDGSGNGAFIRLSIAGNGLRETSFQNAVLNQSAINYNFGISIFDVNSSLTGFTVLPFTLTSVFNEGSNGGDNVAATLPGPLTIGNTIYTFSNFSFTPASATPTTGGTSATDGAFSVRVIATAVPEPGAVAMMVGMGITGAGFLGRRRRK